MSYQHVRWMIRKDLNAVLEIANRKEVRWTEDQLTKCLRQRNCIGMVCETDESITGFIVYFLRKHEIDIADLQSLDDESAQSLFSKVKRKLSRDRRKRLSCSVSEYDIDLQKELAFEGFQAVGDLSGSHYRFVFSYEQLPEANAVAEVSK